MRLSIRGTFLGGAALAVIALASPARAQQPTPPPDTGPKVGETAPDFTLPAATRYGLLKDQVSLSSLRGQTVVLAFFPKARTKG
jgi:peroxiredoxin Q/BCP